ncbi:carboxypeptidase-like regulatory domain-containing protein [Chitinophaga dinghuensis]|nr:carboxypeptidase-like regulatory domain-containing protein [Chitinophaga dinghuensis]
MKRTITISIPEPCHEQWERMESRCGGNYCKQCQKTVMDFTALTDQELLDKLSDSPENICGRFDSSQVNRIITEKSKSRRPLLPAFAMSSFLSLVFPDVLKAQQVDTTINASKPSYDTSCVPFEFYGVVLDAVEKIPIPGVTIKCKGTNLGTASSSEGKFHFHIPEGYQRRKLEFEFGGIGYGQQNILLDAQTGSGPQQIMLQRSATNLSELQVVASGFKKVTTMMGYVVCVRKFSWWHRFVDHFKKCRYHRR